MKNRKKYISAFFILFSVFLSGCSGSQVENKTTTNIAKSPKNYTKNNPDEVKKKQCPSGFVLVPGNSLYETTDFCVMKYDAKCASISNPNQPFQPDKNSACSGMKDGKYEGVYKNNGVGCACKNDKEVVSAPSGFPITFIPMSGNADDNAKAYCQNRGWHLITNQEWMTIARNIENIDANWCDRNGNNCGAYPGTPGKILANGHNDGNNEPSASAGVPTGALIAGNDNAPCFGTTTDGSNVCGGKGSQKRTLQLGNGEIIWDFAGNVWQWVDAVIARKDQPQSKTGSTFDSGWKWSDFTAGSLPSVIINNGNEETFGYNAFRPSNQDWNANNGVGRIYHYNGINDKDNMQYGYIRGGNWRHGYDSGAFCVHLSPVPNKTNIDDVGFRCAVSPQ